MTGLSRRAQGSLSACLSMAAACVAAFAAPARADDASAPDFNRDIRPILAGKCLRCHGGVRELAGVHLGDRDRALGVSEKGRHPIVPGDPDASELLRRVSLVGKGRMPPEGDALSDAEIERLRAWIASGAAFEPLWSFVPPVDAAPTVRDESWIRSPLDRFTLATMEAAGVRPSPEADKSTLLRRASLDLIGLPPTVEELDRFLADESPQAFEREVDRLLASPRFGERWARVWLDLARYADTQGYEKDARRTIWAFRDWLILALDADMPYDQFVTRLLAGDLVPNATNDDRIASAFHRNTLTNAEGGTDDEEFRMAAVFDRVSVTWQAFLGTTFQCVQCHAHPYDPFAHREYYEFLAFFNQSADRDQPDESPTLELHPPGWRARLVDAADALRARGFDEPAFLAWLEANKAKLPPPKMPNWVIDLLHKPETWSDPVNRAALMLGSRRDDPIAARELNVLSPTTVPVMQELPVADRRTTHVLERGSLKKPGDAVEPKTPAVMNPWPADAPPNRLGLAQWMTARENPLFGRVAVNRLWETLFGRGIVETSEDFGSQGSPPTDQALLDHLAVRYAALEWSTKRLLREIVVSSTYRQSSVTTPEALARDPQNRLLARAPRFRLEAEAVRDSALSVAGLLSDRKFGPSVMPLQPEGVWQIVYSNDSWKTSAGEDQYRRSIYTFLRRSSPHPAMVAFDAPSRETCTVRRIRSNSPLAALVTFNDPALLEAARALARRAMDGTSDEASVASALLRRALLRDPQPAETARLVALFRSERERLASDAASVVPLAGAEDSALAAWTVVASVVLSLDEFLSRS
ncbi:MAG: PSD1 domain-containing protein [Phycisphaerae bacterium]|nr:PSD1 domain-containing protein [Phycisphaerae bacterium]